MSNECKPALMANVLVATYEHEPELVIRVGTSGPGDRVKDDTHRRPGDTGVNTRRPHHRRMGELHVAPGDFGIPGHPGPGF